MDMSHHVHLNSTAWEELERLAGDDSDPRMAAAARREMSARVIVTRSVVMPEVAAVYRPDPGPE